MKRMVVLFLMLFIIISIKINYANATTNKITIVNEGPKQVYSNMISGQLRIRIEPAKLYNDRMYLSYHIYDKDNKLLSWEGERSPFKLENYVGTVRYNIDLNKYVDLKKYKYLKIVFDIVDEKNVFWTSKNGDINFTSDSVIYRDDFLKRMTQIWINSFRESPLILSFNIIIFIIFIVLVKKISTVLKY